MSPSELVLRAKARALTCSKLEASRPRSCSRSELQLSAHARVDYDAADASTEAVQVRITDAGVVRADLLVDVARTQGAAFIGSVLVDSSEIAIAGADIAISALAISTRSDEHGAFRLRGIPAGTHVVSVKRVGYLPLETPLAFGAHDRVERRVRLHRVVVLDSMRVTAQASVNRSFDDHRRVGLGSFLSRAEIEKVEGRSMANIVRQLRGANVAVGTGNRAWLTTKRGDKSTGATQACYAHVYLDGIQIYGARSRANEEPLFDLNSISPDRLEAIEYYSGAASTPPEYSTLNSTCGVLVLWSRRTFDTP